MTGSSDISSHSLHLDAGHGNNNIHDDDRSDDRDLALRSEYEELLLHATLPHVDIDTIIDKLRIKVLLHGLPDETSLERNSVVLMNRGKRHVEKNQHSANNYGSRDISSSLRCRVWMALLRIGFVDVPYYVTCVERGATEIYARIVQDAFRTFRNDKVHHHSSLHIYITSKIQRN